MQKQINQILGKAWVELYTHYEENQPTLRFSDSDDDLLTLSWLDGEPVKPFRALELLATVITISLREHNKVIIYTCKDNGEIAISNPNTLSEIGIEEILEQDEEITQLYWAFD